MHILKVYLIDPEIILEKIVVNPDNNHPGYFGATPIVHYANKKDVNEDNQHRHAK